MKRILFILAVCLSLNGMTQEKTYTVSWRVAYEITDPCPDVPRMDKFGRLSGGMIGCLVHHYHIEYEYKSKEFVERELAFNFYNEALQEQSYYSGILSTDGNIDSVQIDSITKPTQEVDSLLFETSTEYTSPVWDRPIFVSDIRRYIESCKDTITAVACGNGEFTIRDSEIVTSSQMKKRGYDFYRRHYWKDNISDIKYIFVKEPTLMGFYSC